NVALPSLLHLRLEQDGHTEIMDPQRLPGSSDCRCPLQLHAFIWTSVDENRDVCLRPAESPRGGVRCAATVQAGGTRTPAPAQPANVGPGHGSFCSPAPVSRYAGATSAASARTSSTSAAPATAARAH